jgi:two-component system, NtrC family, sensor kinase
MSEAQAPPLTEPSINPKVLVVDDVYANLKLTKAILEPLSCEVVLAHSGREAIDQLDQNEFAVLLLDVQMPDMDGYALARAARQIPAARDIPIIFLTAADPDNDNVLRGYDTGAVDYLFKPLNATILRSKVRVFLDLHKTQRHLVAANRRLERAYEDQKTMQAQLVQSAKMASLGELVAGIAHELNNPLAFVLSHLGTARRSLDRAELLPGLSLSPPAKDEWDRANNRLREMGVGLDRIQNLVTKLRAFSRLDEEEWKVVDVREGVESVLMILAHRLEGRIAVETEFGTPHLVRCYPSLLNQAILNIVANAVDAIPESGTITIRTGESGGNYEIMIADDGPGIPAHLQARVFEPFFTTKPVGQGTGLGLAISYSIARKHGGTLLVECPEGGGTALFLRFPISKR